MRYERSQFLATVADRMNSCTIFAICDLHAYHTGMTKDGDIEQR
jgi:hypothetical protein